MQLGMIGLGRMGANMVRRLTRAGHDLVVFDVSADAVKALEAEGATGATSLEDFAAKLTAPRSAWVMVPAGYTADTVRKLADLFDADDTIIDGGNSYYRDDVDIAAELKPKGIHYVDVGTSGGVFGLERGYCLMIGGDDTAVGRLDPIFEALAPGVGEAPRTPGTSGEPSRAEKGYLHCGPNGAGHFVKMVHNGIEYAIMGAYAEGLNILAGANIGKLQHEIDAETTPVRDPQYYQYDLDTADVAEVWRRGSVIGSWLLDLTAAALREDPTLQSFAGRVSDSGEGRWTSIAAIDEGVPAPLLTEALYSRFLSRGLGDFAFKIQSAQRKQFGGHDEKKS
ncbi:MAG TPA: decarboxylating 6-phosphogluconate dehydrogenase [Micromonosporaceae bacterium]|jgi:6-phosphogluconate dehydrogenase